MRGLNKTHSLKALFICALGAIILLAIVAILYSSIREASFAKIEPYHVSIKVFSESDSRLNVEYDYGYGYNAGHSQSFDLIGNQNQMIDFTISAWKQLQSFRLSNISEIKISSVAVTKQHESYQALGSVNALSAGSYLVFDDVNQKLLEAK